MKLKKNEQVKDVCGYEGFYAVTSLGRVWSVRRKMFLQPGLVGRGYLSVVLSVNNHQESFKVHRLVGKAFVENPESKPCINHLNGDKKDCRASNLKWVTQRENLQHACDHGLNKTYKLSYHEKWEICKLHASKLVSQVKLAKMFNVTPPSIHYIISTYSPLIGI
jgi:hydroxyacyl-ACP dehydratase HTD2-like protein with hotdog domain